VETDLSENEATISYGSKPHHVGSRMARTRLS
jgi:hypothetical protein